ncbi:MAG TPA: MBL fold metallo-hydrolase [Acidobacteriaceae bacterium]
MMRMTVLASGSRGNSTVVASSRTRILVDAGLSCRELFKRMQQAGEDPCALDAILITHEHQDHVQGLSVAARRLGIPVYVTEATHRAWLRWMNPQKRLSYADWLARRKQEMAERAAAPAADACAPEGLAIPEAGPAMPAARAASLACDQVLAECAAEQEELASLCPAGERDEPAAKRVAADPCALPGVEYFRAGARFSIGDIEVMPFTIPHDAADPVGFVLEAEGIRIGIATDLGYMPANVSQQLRRCDMVMLESNHDVDMLREGPYPWSVKQRVLSRVGHLSNAAAAEFLEKGYDGQATYVVLAHLSESNNLPVLARLAAEFALRNRMSLLANRLVLAGQHAPTESLCL